MTEIGRALQLVGLLILSFSSWSTSEDAIDAVPQTGTSISTFGDSAQPFLFQDTNRQVYLSWLETIDSSTTALKFAQWQNGSWTDPKTVASGQDWFVNWADVPSMTFIDESTLVAHWLQKLGESRYAYGVRISLSHDGGTSWTDPQWLHDDTSDSEHGFAVMEAISSGSIVSAWLDGRKYAEGVQEMSLVGRSFSKDGTMGSETVVDPLVCDCCPVSSTVSSSGNVTVVYRNRTEDEIRDIYTATFDGQVWHEPVNVHPDGWMIAGCPVNGPSIDAGDSRTVVSWFTMSGGSPRVLATFGSLSGDSYQTPTQIDLGNPVGRTGAAMLEDGTALVLWIENNVDENASLLIRRIGAKALSDPVVVGTISSARAAGVPRLLVAEDSIHVAWTATGVSNRIATRVLPITDL